MTRTKNVTTAAVAAGDSTGSILTVNKAGRKPILDHGDYIDRAPLSWRLQDLIMATLQRLMGDAPINVDDLPDPFAADDPIAQAKENLTVCGIEFDANDSDVSILRAWHQATAITSPLRVAYSEYRGVNSAFFTIGESFAGREDRKAAQVAAAAKSKEKAAAAAA